MSRIPHNFKDLTGLTINRLIVIKKMPIKGNGARWLCKCTCGSKKRIIASSGSINSGQTKSCGCYAREMASKRKITHGYTKRNDRKSEYHTWSTMKRRCHNPNNRDYGRYGGKGIIVCERWRNSFENFILDIGNKPTPNHTLDRINSKGNYEPSNCRWATQKEQQNNRGDNSFLTINGESKTISQWAELVTHITGSAISYRKRKGWSDYDCVFKRNAYTKKRTKI